MKGGAITDDHMWAVFARGNGEIDVYTFNGVKFILDSTIPTVRDDINSLALTNDHIMLAISTSSAVYVYKHNGTKFNREQTINIINLLY